jgi:MFS family permease
MLPVLVGGVGLGAGFICAGLAPGHLDVQPGAGAAARVPGHVGHLRAAGVGHLAVVRPRRGIALAICMSGNYVAGAVWPPVMQHFIDGHGWRNTYIGMGVFCLATILPLALFLRPAPPLAAVAAPAAGPEPPVSTASGRSACRPARRRPAVRGRRRVLRGDVDAAGAHRGVLQRPGFGAARGAEMLSLMLGMGVVSRLVSGWISDRIGGLRTLLLGSVLQGIALLCFLPAAGMMSLYAVSAMFGLFQGGIVPSYALIVRQHFPPRRPARASGRC